MRRKTFSMIRLLLMAVLLPGSATAAEEAVTLREAVTMALVKNHLLKGALSQKDAAAAALAAARTGYLPRVYLDSGATLSNTPSTVFMMKLDEGRISPARDFTPDSLNHPSPRGDFRTAFVLEQPLLDFSIATGIDLARKEEESADLSLQMQREEVAFRVFEAYLEVRRAREFVAVADEGASDAREHARLACARVRNGYGLKSDELRAATEAAEAEQRLISARHDLTLARLRLNMVAGGQVGAALDIAGEPAIADPSGSQAELIQLALLNRPDLKEGATAVEKGDLAVRQARRAYLPTVYASASYQLNDRDIPFGNDNDSWNAGLSLRWELFDGTRRSQEKRRALSARDAASSFLENQRREVALQVTESLLRRSEARLKLGSARAALSAAEEGVRLVAKRFENGLSAMVELMDAEATVNRSRANLVEVENGCLRATAQVYYTAGVFLKEVTK